MLLLLLVFVFGCIAIEVIGTRWHHLVAHRGFLGRFLPRVTQGRHLHHHAFYHKDSLTDQSYRKSCELTFHPMGVSILLILVVVGVLVPGWWLYLVTFFAGCLTWGILVLGKLHDLYHVDEEVIRQMWIFQFQLPLSGYLWLRDYHHIHHLWEDCNNAIVFAFLDWLWGTFVHPRNLEVAKTTAVLPKGLFGNFDTKMISWCGRPWW